MNKILIPANSNLINEVASYIKGKGKDYSSNMVVFPGKRPAHFLRRTLSEKERSSFIPPSIFSIDEFVDFIYEEKLGVKKRKISSSDAVAILFNIHCHTMSPLWEKSFNVLDGFLPIGLKVYEDLEELYIEDISVAKIKEVIPLFQEIAGHTSHILHSLSYYYEEFYKKVSKAGLSTRALRYRTVSEAIERVDFAAYRKVIFAGFFALTKSEGNLVRKLLSRENTLFIFQNGSGIKENIASLGITFDTRVDAANKPEIHFYSATDAHGQVLRLRDMIKGEIIDENTVIVVPSPETLFPLIYHTLTTISEEHYNISLGYPIQRTPIFGFLNNLMHLVSSIDNNRFYLPDYLKFVLHPYIKNIYFANSAESVVTRIMFHAIEERFTEKETKTFLYLDEIEHEKVIKDIIVKLSSFESSITIDALKQHLISIHDSTIRKFISFQNIGDFASRATEILLYIYERSTARRHRFFTPFFEDFIKVLEDVSRSMLKPMSFKETNGYFNFFRRYIAAYYSHFPGTPLRGLQVLGFLETRNLRFEKVFILDVNEEVLPAVSGGDTLLPFKVRKALNIPTYKEREKIANYYFETLIKGSRESHIIFIENDRKERSRFVEKLLWEKQKRERKTDTDGFIKTVQYRVSLKNRLPESIQKTAEVVELLKGFGYSPTSLNVYLKCPIKFYYSHVINLGEKGEISEELEKKAIGNFIHRILNKFFSERKGYLLSVNDIEISKMDNIVESQFEENYGKDPAGSVYLLKKQIKNRMKDFLENYQIPLVREQKITIIDTEVRIPNNNYIRYTINGQSFNLKGKIDRIEIREVNGVIQNYIIDYKTSATDEYLKIKFDKLNIEERETWFNSIGSIQLPFYLLLYSLQTGKNIGEIQCLFLLLGKNKIDKKIEASLFKSPDEIIHYQKIRTIIDKLLTEIANQDIPFKPPPNLKNTCSICEFRYVCGTQWIENRVP